MICLAAEMKGSPALLVYIYYESYVVHTHPAELDFETWTNDFESNAITKQA